MWKVWVVSHCLLGKVDNIGKPLRHQTDNGLKTRSTDMALSLLGQDVVSHQDLVGTSPTIIWGGNLQE